MKHLEKIIIFFLSLVALYHIVVVGGVFGAEFGSSTLYALIRDGLRAVIVLLVATQVEGKKIRTFLEDRGYEVLLILILIARGVGFSLFKGASFADILIGYKYDIHFFVIAMSAVFVGYTALKHKKKHTKEIGELIYRTIALIIILGAVYQGVKMLMPDLFLSLGYGAIGDYVVGANPPLRYRTGPGGLPRLQGLFAGPNNYGYFLAGIFSFILVRSRHVWREDKENRYLVAGVWALYIMSLLFTLSRGAFVAIFFQLVVLGLISFKKLLKNKTSNVLFGLLGLAVLFSLVIGLSYIKAGSTALHLTAWVEGRQAFIANPMGYGLGISGPSVHYEGIYMPESQFLQIMLDMGVIGMLLRILCRKVLLTPSLKHLLIDKSIRNLPLFTLLGLGILGLMIEGFFLHVREDSMVNYLLLIPFGILLGMSREPGDIL